MATTQNHGKNKGETRNKLAGGTKDLTVPQPFQFHSRTRKAANVAPNSPFVPLALKVKAFEANTPERLKKKVFMIS